MNNSLPAKPKKGNPCNGCGACCGNEICAIGRHMFPDADAPCPALVYKEGRIWCKFVLIEEALGVETTIGNALGVGKGCCGDDWVSTED